MHPASKEKVVQNATKIELPDTRLATSLLSQGKLEDQTASGVKVSGTVTAPLVTPL